MNIALMPRPPVGERPDPQDIASCIAWVEARYLCNARDDQFIDYCREVLTVDAAGLPTAVPVRNPLNGETRGLAVIGESGAGKSVMIRRGLQALPGFREMTAGADGNYLSLTVSPEATVKSLTNDLLGRTGYGATARKATAHELLGVCRHRVQSRDVGLIWIDEAHHLLRPGPGRDVAAVLRTLKNLLQGPGAVAVILSGVPKLNEDLIADPETDRRFLRQRLWSLEHDADVFPTITRFVEACCDAVGLAGPEDDHFAHRLVFAENGVMGKALDLAKGAIRRAIIARSPALTLDHAGKVFDLQRGPMRHGPFSAVPWPELKQHLEALGWA